MVYRSYFLAFLCFLSTFTSLSADPSDGLDAATRPYFYNSKTTVVARVDLTLINSATFDQTIRGLFDDTSWGFISKDMGKTKESGALYFTIASALSEGGFKQVTIVGIEDGAGKIGWFGIVPLNKMNDITFAGVQGTFIIATSKTGLDMTRLGDYAVVHQKALPIPDKKQYSTAIEELIILGIDQAKPTAPIAWVALATPSLNSQISEALKESSESSPLITTLTSATYYGGYFFLGSNPSVYLYARFATEEKAKSMLQLYDQKFDQTIAKGIEDDKKHEEANQTSKVKVYYYISLEDMYKHLKEALPAKTFGNVFILPWDAVNLRTATTALVDRYVRPPRKEESK